MSNFFLFIGEEVDLVVLFFDFFGCFFINFVFYVGVEWFQQMFFLDLFFFQGFLQQCKFIDVILSFWSGDSKCYQCWVLMYIIFISNLLGFKSVFVVEIQMLFWCGFQVGGCVVDFEVLMQGIFYQDYFYIVYCYCILGLVWNKVWF